MLLAYYVHDLSPFLIELRPGLGLRWYGLAYVGAFLAGIAVYRWLARKGYSDIPPEKVSDFIVWGAIFGVLVGGRLGYMLFYNLDGFISNPLSVFMVWDGGMASHGGILGLVVFTFWYAKRHHVRWLNIGDNLVVVSPIGLFFGRLANFINGELYGRPADVPWAVQFPGELRSDPLAFAVESDLIQQARQLNPAWTSPTIIAEEARRSPELQELLADYLTPRHPSQLYEAFLEGAVLFAILWTLRLKFRLPNGVLTGVFFIGYAILRIIGEIFREPDAPLTWILTRGQFLSLFMIVIGVGFVVVAFRLREYPRIFQRG